MMQSRMEDSGLTHSSQPLALKSHYLSSQRSLDTLFWMILRLGSGRPLHWWWCRRSESTSIWRQMEWPRFSKLYQSLWNIWLIPILKWGMLQVTLWDKLPTTCGLNSRRTSIKWWCQACSSYCVIQYLEWWPMEEAVLLILLKACRRVSLGTIWNNSYRSSLLYCRTRRAAHSWKKDQLRVSHPLLKLQKKTSRLISRIWWRCLWEAFLKWIPKQLSIWEATALSVLAWWSKESARRSPCLI